MQLITGLAEVPGRLGILPGTFNPPTRAHMGLAESALAHVDHVLLVLPGRLPHKTWEGASPEQRVEMLRILTSDSARIGAARAEGGLFIDMVREARVWFPETEFYLVCGKDAAERILGWDYGEPDAISSMLAEFRLLVAPRHGEYQPPDHVAHAVSTLQTSCWDEYSSTSVRDEIAGSADWQRLVPDAIQSMVAEIYR